MTYLAEFMISGEWLTTFVVAVIGAFGGLYAKARRDVRKATESRDVTVKDPVPEVPVKRVYSPPTFFQHRALEERVSRVEADQREMRRENAENFMKLMEAGETRQNRLIDKMDQMARSIHARIDQITHPQTKNSDG